VRALLCHRLGDNDMNRVTANDERQELVRRGPRLVIKGHRHRHAIWRVGGLTLVDAGALLDRSAPCGVVVDAAERTIAPLRFTAAAAVADQRSLSRALPPTRVGADDERGPACPRRRWAGRSVGGDAVSLAASRVTLVAATD
jgi:hypothetical protein